MRTTPPEGASQTVVLLSRLGHLVEVLLVGDLDGAVEQRRFGVSELREVSDGVSDEDRRTGVAAERECIVVEVLLAGVLSIRRQRARHASE